MENTCEMCDGTGYVIDVEGDKIPCLHVVEDKMNAEGEALMEEARLD